MLRKTEVAWNVNDAGGVSASGSTGGDRGNSELPAPGPVQPYWPAEFVRHLNIKGDGEFLMALAIAQNADWKTGECRVHQATLAAAARCGERTARKRLDELEGRKVIGRVSSALDVGRGRKPDQITLSGYAEWVAPALAARGTNRQHGCRKVSDDQPAISARPTGNFSRPTGKRVAGIEENKRTRITGVTPNPLQGEDDDAIQIVNGKIVLSDAKRAEWLSRFGGDAERLDLALIEAAGRIRPGRRRSLSSQVEGFLAGEVAEKRDRDQRYERAAGRDGEAPARRARAPAERYAHRPAYSPPEHRPCEPEAPFQRSETVARQLNALRRSLEATAALNGERARVSA
jgi:hypothetical protein